MTRRHVQLTRLRAHLSQHGALKCAALAAVPVVLAASLSAAPEAMADPDETLTAAVSAARAGSCKPLQLNSLVQHAAENVNDSNDKWISNNSRAAPVPDATPLLKDFGYDTSKSVILAGAASTPADSIKALLLSGYNKIPDCSFVVYGASSMYNEPTGLVVTAVVLAA